MTEIYAVRCTEKVEYDALDGVDGVAGYFDNEKDAEDLVSWIKENSLSCDFDVYVEPITLGEIDIDFISWVIS